MNSTVPPAGSYVTGFATQLQRYGNYLSKKPTQRRWRAPFQCARCLWLWFLWYPAVKNPSASIALARWPLSRVSDDNNCWEDTCLITYVEAYYQPRLTRPHISDRLETQRWFQLPSTTLLEPLQICWIPSPKKLTRLDFAANCHTMSTSNIFTNIAGGFLCPDAAPSPWRFRPGSGLLASQRTSSVLKFYGF